MKVEFSLAICFVLSLIFSTIAADECANGIRGSSLRRVSSRYAWVEGVFGIKPFVSGELTTLSSSFALSNEGEVRLSFAKEDSSKSTVRPIMVSLVKPFTAVTIPTVPLMPIIIELAECNFC